jgi:hypothetical protein
MGLPRDREEKMLGEFLTPANSKARAKIVKFCDRVFVDCLTQQVDILRSIVVHVLPESEERLEGLYMLCPCAAESFRTTRDISKTCFLSGEEYHFNSTKTLGYKVLAKPSTEEDGVGSVYVDGFSNVSVFTHNTIRVEPHVGASLVRVEFDTHPVEPGQIRELRVLLRLDLASSGMTKDVTTPRGHWTLLQLPYLSLEGIEQARTSLGGESHRIPVVPIYSEELQGGFDVFVYLGDACDFDDWNVQEMRIDFYGPDGTRSDHVWRKAVWRMWCDLGNKKGWDLNRCVGADVQCGDPGFDVSGFIRRASRVSADSISLDASQRESGIRAAKVMGWMAIAAFGFSLLTTALIIILLLRS